jgi:MFS family permease
MPNDPGSTSNAGLAGLEREPGTARRAGWGFISLYTLAYISTSLLFLAPLLVTLALKVNSLVGIERAPNSLAVVTGTGALLAMVGNPVFGRLSDRTTSPLGMRRPWMVIGLLGGSLGILIVALAPNIALVLIGWCIAQLLFNALLAALAAVLPDQIPAAQRGMVSGFLGVCVPTSSTNAAKDLGVMNIAGALPFSVAPAIAPAILALSDGSYGVLYTVAGVAAILGAAAILPVKGVR